MSRKTAQAPSPARKVRCAIYTRKSTEEGLEMEFNSLDAQREACEAYVASQKAEGWVLVRDRYDDGGFSGGNLERPALKRLLSDIEAGLVDVVVVYKIDRLSRSLMDFAKLAETLESRNASFVSVTQSFNTNTSMGRLTLNMLLSFAQFEREVAGERIRDKIAASRRKGMWMGGWAPFGYEVKDRKLVIAEKDAEIVRCIFRRFVQLGSATALAKELITKGTRNRYGHKLDKGSLYKLLNNRVYIGDAVHKGQSYPGEHEAIVDRRLWDKAHAILKIGARKRGAQNKAQTPALLKGLIFDAHGRAMSPTHTRKGSRLYRYYISQTALKQPGADHVDHMRVPAGEIERIVIGQVRRLVASPEVVIATWKAARQTTKGITEGEVREKLVAFEALWDELFPIEQARIVEQLVERVRLLPDRLDVVLRIEGFTSLLKEMDGAPELEAA
jgi:site-specific DNA recombinase